MFRFVFRAEIHLLIKKGSTYQYDVCVIYMHKNDYVAFTTTFFESGHECTHTHTHTHTLI